MCTDWFHVSNKRIAQFYGVDFNDTEQRPSGYKRESEGEKVWVWMNWKDKKMNESVEWVTQWLYNGIVYDDEHL